MPITIRTVNQYRGSKRTFSFQCKHIYKLFIYQDIIITFLLCFIPYHQSMKKYLIFSTKRHAEKIFNILRISLFNILYIQHFTFFAFVILHYVLWISFMDYKRFISIYKLCRLALNVSAYSVR